MRPSEVAGLRWSNVDLDRARLTIVRSRHLYEDSAPKTRGPNAPWTCSLKTMHVLRSIEPIRVSTETFVFVNTLGRPLEPRAFLPHWHACLRALGIRARGIYACEDTYISTVLPLKPIPWIEKQTGVAYSTIKRHYGRWMPPATPDEAGAALDELARAKGNLCPPGSIHGKAAEGGASQNAKADSSLGSGAADCRGGESNPYTLAGGGF